MKKKKEKEVGVLFCFFMLLVVAGIAISCIEGVKAFSNSSRLPEGSAPQGSLVVDNCFLLSSTTTGRYVLDGTAEGVTADVYPVIGCVCFVPDDGVQLTDPALSVAHLFRIVRFVANVLSCVLGALCGIALYRGFRRKEKVGRRPVKYLTWTGFAAIVAALALGFASMFYAIGARRMLPTGTEHFAMQFAIDYAQLIVGLLAVFAARLLGTVYDLQLEEELTI